MLGAYSRPEVYQETLRTTDLTWDRDVYVVMVLRSGSSPLPRTLSAPRRHTAPHNIRQKGDLPLQLSVSVSRLEHMPALGPAA